MDDNADIFIITRADDIALDLSFGKNSIKDICIFNMNHVKPMKFSENEIMNLFSLFFLSSFEYLTDKFKALWL